MTDPGQRSGPPIDQEIDARGIAKVGLWLAVVTVAAFVVAWGFYLLLSRGEKALDQPPSPIAEARDPRPVPGPALQATPELELARLRRSEDEKLAGWGWVDRGAGVARIPVDVAIERVAAEGSLPDFTQPLELSSP